MRAILSSIIIWGAMAPTAFTQIDTLQLVEIGSILAPSEITNLYVEDLDGDSLKEIILTTATNVLICNGITYEEIWTSPDLDHPRDLQFADINDDGYVGLSVKCDERIRIFDPNDNIELWSSPVIRFDIYKCYTFGYMGSGDSWPEILIVTKQPFQGIGLDTVWVDGYRGPYFADHYQYTIRVVDVYSFDDGYYWISREQPWKIISARSIDGGLSWNRSYIFTDWFREEGYFEPDGNIEWMRQLYQGRVRCMNTTTNEEIGAWSIGDIVGYGKTEAEGGPLIYLISRSRHFYDSQYETFDRYVKFLNLFTGDSLISSDTLWFGQDTDWQGFIVGDLNYQISGDEYACASGDTVYLYTFPDLGVDFESGPVPNLHEILSSYRAESLFDMPQILCSLVDSPNRLLMVDGNDGGITVAVTERNLDIAAVVDADMDGDDEIFSVSGNSLFICGLQRTYADDDNHKLDQNYLFPNYPNPFNSSTTIEYSLPEAGEVSIDIFDLLGRKVETLVEGKQDAGTYRVTWNAEDQSSGVYFYMIKAGDYKQTKWMLLLK